MLCPIETVRKISLTERGHLFVLEQGTSGFEVDTPQLILASFTAARLLIQGSLLWKFPTCEFFTFSQVLGGFLKNPL